MTATEELRRMLDERGIKHFDYSKSGWSQTQWEAPDGNRHFTYETYDNPAKTAKLVISWFPTPEQAIAATLDAGECELVYGENDYGDDGWWCQSCGGWFAVSFRHTGRNNIIVPSYCQQCGKAVKR